MIGRRVLACHRLAESRYEASRRSSQGCEGISNRFVEWRVHARPG
jgi:hypothetical protein